MSSKPKHVVLWGAWYGSHNVGDQAILITIVKMLRQRLGALRFTVFTADPGRVLEYGPEETGSEFQALSNKKQFHRQVLALARCDLFVIGGGVPFYQRPLHLMAMAVLVGLARLFGTPYMTWAVASQKIDSRRAKRLFRWVAEGAGALTYRDPLTGKMFQSCGVTRNMVWCADPVFRLEAERGERIQTLIDRARERASGRFLAALACRQMKHDHSYSLDHHNQKSRATVLRMIESFAGALDWMWENGYQPILVPMNTVAPDDDREMARLIADSAVYGSKSFLIDEDLSPLAVPALLEECELCIASRLHAGVLAMVANCPVLMYSIGPKIVGIMETMGLSEWCVDDETTSTEEVVGLLRRLDRSRASIRRQMAGRLEELREDATIPAKLASEMLRKAERLV